MHILAEHVTLSISYRAVLNILGYVEHTRGEPSLRASVASYIISHDTCYISRCTNVHRYIKHHYCSHQTIAWQEFSAHTLAKLFMKSGNLLRSRKLIRIDIN